MSRRSMPYHRRYHGDALTGYAKLSLEERGAYTTLLDLIYDAGGPILHDRRPLAGWLQCSLRKLDVLIAALIEKGKIYVTQDGKLSNRRADQELRFALEISRKNAENATKAKRDRGEKQKLPNKNSDRAQRPLSDRSAIPEPEPDIINSLEYDVAPATTASEELDGAAAAPPIRRETFAPGTAAERLMKIGAGDLMISADSSRRLSDALNRKSSSRWPVPIPGQKPPR